MDKIFLSIIICTHNRAGFLKKLLDSLIKQTFSQDLFEILIIDNASTDNTEDIFNDYKTRFKNYTYYYEEKIGLSYAKNTGIELSKGNIIAYIDDDATVNNQWVEIVYKVFNESDPIPSALGGKILPDWEIERPVWYPDELLSYISCVDNGPEPKEITYNKIYGGNSAYPKDKLLEYGKFDPKLGRVENKQATHEERLVLYNMQENNEVLFYHPEMVLYHFIPKERSTYKYLIERAIGSGKSGAVLDSISTFKHKNVLKDFIRDFFFTIFALIGIKEKKYFYMCSVRMCYFASYLMHRMVLFLKK